MVQFMAGVIILLRSLRKGSVPYSRDGSLGAVELLAFGLENAFGEEYEEAHQACTAFNKGMAKLPRQKRYKPSLFLRIYSCRLRGRTVPSSTMFYLPVLNAYR